MIVMIKPLKAPIGDPVGDHLVKTHGRANLFPQARASLTHQPHAVVGRYVPFRLLETRGKGEA